MKTRILLHGGNSSMGGEKNDKFFADIINGVDKDTIQVLCIYFARPEGRWEDSYAEDQSIFRARALETGKDVETVLATYDLDEFVEQITASDVIFINGGYQGRLKETLLKIGVDNFRQMVEGKTLVGVSAGANILTKYYYSMAASGIREGIGILPIKLLTHSNVDTSERFNLLQAYKEDLPIVKIAEEEYVVLK